MVSPVSSKRSDYNRYDSYLLTVSPNTYKKYCTLLKLSSCLEFTQKQIPNSIFWKKVFFEVAPKKKTLHLHTACLIPKDYEYKKLVKFIQSTRNLRIDFRAMPYMDAQRYASKYHHDPILMEQDAYVNYINQSYAFSPCSPSTK